MAALLASAFLLFALVGRVFVQFYKTGNHGIRLADPCSDPVAFVAGSVFSLSFAVSIVIVVLDLVGIWTIPPVPLVSLNVLACTLGFAGVLVVVTAQWQMGSAWRIGVDPSEKTALVTHGLYSKSRNPIYFGIALYWMGLSVLLPHPTVWLLAALCWLSIEVIVRKVEEPFLHALHGLSFERYTQRTSRYLIW